jgi:hypothetical protein
MSEANRDRESDVDTDDQVANTRAVGGDPERSDEGAGSTTGTGRSGEFVGRVSGEDETGEEETGAEARHDR